ncbi:MAG: hypothetical protein ACYC91_11275 [Solirubrobacteraceae bacterium]
MKRLLDACRGLLASEEGFVMVIAMLLIVVGLAVGAAALSETLAARDHSARDERSARALEAADAGVQTELYRASQLNLGSQNLSGGLSLSAILSQLLTCPVPQINSSGQVTGLQFVAIASLGSACPSNSASGTPSPGPDKEAVGQHGYFQAAFVPGLGNVGDFVTMSPKIVASGVDDTGGSPGTQVSRRVEAILAPITPWRTLEANHDLTFDVPPTLSALGLKLAGSTVFNGTAAAGVDLNIDGTAGLANVFTASNITLSGGATAPSALDSCNQPVENNVTVSVVLGNITHVTSGCSGLVSRPAISVSPNKVDCAPDTGVVDCSTLLGSSYTASTDSLLCASACPGLAFQPGDYVFCDFEYNGAVSLNPSALGAVRIFIDDPGSSRCPGRSATHSDGGATGFRTNYGNFVATHGVGNALGATNPSQAQVYVTGNGTPDGTVAYATGDTTISSQDMFLYAPTSQVTVTGGETCVLGTCVNSGTLAGTFIGFDLNASATAVTEDLGLLNYPLSSTLGPFYVKQYIECTPQYPPPSPDPTTGC